MHNSNKLMYTATYKAVTIHADLQLARKPRVAAHTPPRDPGQPDLQLAIKPRVAANTAKSYTTGPTTCKEAAHGCPHARRSELLV